ncbi:MAG: aminodeoxychorismate/anthranilate synthase component II [Phycisphaerae bacterium]|nr:aminodeoxychorismate/anthranilate synthase component II [Phycisphaerae bacterium]
MLLIIDNYDSFTYNLVQAIGAIDVSLPMKVARNDELTLADIERLRPSRVIISPGPGTPADAGISRDLIRAWAGRAPILGVCLGHQCIADVFGATVGPAARLMHGKTSLIHHDGSGVFRGMSNPFAATRYHSLAVERSSLPPVLIETARSDRDELMGLRHRDLPIEGVQFHPESFLTTEGSRLLANFLNDR